MGASESRGARGDAGEIVTVDAGRHADDAEATDPVLQQLALLRSVEPILPSGDVSFGEQLAAEVEAQDGPPGANAAANAIKALRSWNRERADGVAATQELLMTRVDRAELLAGDVMRRASRAGAVGRMLAADLKHARPLQQELATLGAQLCAVLESYAQLLKTFEAAAARRSVGASPLRPAALPPAALPMSPLRLAQAPAAAAQLPGGFSLEAAAPPAPGSARASWSYVGRGGDGHSSPQLLRVREPRLSNSSARSGAANSPRVGRSDLPDSPESLGREPRGSPTRFSLDSSRSSASASSGRSSALGPQPQPQQQQQQQQAQQPHPQQAMLPPLRVPLPPVRTSVQPDAKPLSPAAMLHPGGGGTATAAAAAAGGGSVPSTPTPTPQSKRALFGAVAEAAAAAAAGGAPMSASIAVSTSATSAGATGSPRATLRPEAPSARSFALEAVTGSPRHVRLGPVALSPGGASADRSGSPSMLRMDPWRGSGVDAFSIGPPALGSEPPTPSSASSTASGGAAPAALAALQPLQPLQPRSPLRGMGRRGEGVTPRALSGLGPHTATTGHTPRSGGSLFSDAPADGDADPQDYRMASKVPPGPGVTPTRRLS